MTELERLIMGSYGTVDDEFAKHPNDAGRAREALAEAGKEQVGFDDYLKMHEKHLKSKGRSDEHIQEQLERVKDIRNYFDYD